MNLEFITGLAEARMYRGTDTLKGKKVDDLATAAYLLILMLEVLRTDDTNYAKGYASKTMQYENFETMRTSATDLHNLLAVVNNQNDYEEILKLNPDVAVPVLQIRRYLRDIIADRKQVGLDKEFFLTLERFLCIKDSTLKHIRRTVADWEHSGKMERSSVRKQLKNYTPPSATQADLLVHFRSITKQHEI